MLKREKNAVHAVLAHLHRVRTYLLKPDVAICRKGNGQATTTLHAVRPDGVTFYEIEKEIGSELALLFTAIDHLERLTKS